MRAFKRQRSTQSDGYTTQFSSPGYSQGYYPRARVPRKMSVRAKFTERKLVTASAVKKIVTGLAEKKICQTELTLDVSAYNQPNWTNNGILPLSPMSTYLQIDQGVSQEQRIGNKIRPYSCTLDLLFTPQLYNATSNTFPYPTMVRVIVFSQKESNDLPTSLPNFFQQGSSATAPISTGFDMILPVNKDVYTPYYDRVIKLGTSSWPTNISGGNPNAGGYGNNDYSLNPMLHIDVTKYLPSVVTFNDNLSNPTSKAVFVTILASRSDGTTSATTQIPGRVFASLKFKYTDE